LANAKRVAIPPQTPRCVYCLGRDATGSLLELPSNPEKSAFTVSAGTTKRASFARINNSNESSLARDLRRQGIAAAPLVIMFSALREAWNTYDRDPWRRELWLMTVYIFGRWRYRIKFRPIRAPLSFSYRVLKTISEILTGIELPCETQVGRRLRIEHCGDIVVSGDAVLGDDVVIRNGVTIGLRRIGERGSPKIGNRVDIGSGAKILGPITIGDDAVIGANAVVLNDVPPGATAVGIPAQILLRRRKPILQHENDSVAVTGPANGGLDYNGGLLP
jgi:serine O-acetyltransferase